MAVNNVLLLLQFTGYIVAFMLSLCIVAPLSLNLSCFRGRCLLFTDGTFGDDGAFNPRWSSGAPCVYTLLVGVFLAVTSLAQAARSLRLLRRESDSSFPAAFLDCVAASLLAAACFAAAIAVTLGLRAWCGAVTQRFRSCDEATIVEISGGEDLDPSGFFVQVGTVQFGAWSSWVCWVLLAVLSTLKLCRYHEKEAIRVSMARQRQKIINQCD